MSIIRALSGSVFMLSFSLLPFTHLRAEPVQPAPPNATSAFKLCHVKVADFRAGLAEIWPGYSSWSGEPSEKFLSGDFDAPRFNPAVSALVSRPRGADLQAHQSGAYLVAKPSPACPAQQAFLVVTTGNFAGQDIRAYGPIQRDQ